MFSRKKFFVLLSVLLFGGGILFEADQLLRAEEMLPLVQEDLATLTKPSVVRIAQYVKGEAVIRPFYLDFDNFEIKEASGEATKVSVDEYITGSGFIISEDGFVLTNSHVVSSQAIKLKIVSKIVQDRISELGSRPDSPINRKDQTEKFKDFAKKIREYLLENSEFNFQEGVAVLNPASTKEKMGELYAEGFPARLVSVNKNFYKDNWDIGLIKIDQRNLPALKLAEASPVESGKKIFVFGFPATAEINSRNVLESTFTAGVVSALRDSENQDFKIIQTDAKISQGSSGSPLLNEIGEAIGVITYQSNGEAQKEGGDNFAFAVPIEIVKEGIEKFKLDSAIDLNFKLGDFEQKLGEGLRLFRGENCREALVRFSETEKRFNENFVSGESLKHYSDQCQTMIAENRSVDTPWAKSIKNLKQVPPTVFALIAMVVLGFSLGLVMFFRQSNKDDAKIEEEIEAIQADDKKDDAKVEAIEDRVDKIEKINGLAKANGKLEVLDRVEEKMEDLEQIEDKIDDKLEKLEKIEEKLEKIEELEEKIEEIEKNGKK